MRWLSVLVGALCAVVCAGSARAEWFRAETDRFIVYGDVDQQALRDYAVRLSKFDQVLRIYAPTKSKDPPARKFEAYLVRGHGGLARVQPGLPETVGGFYFAGLQAVFAIGMTQPYGVTSKDVVLFHEYAHHFMLENFPAAYPTWFVEGWADYFSTVKFTPEGFEVGGYELARAAWLSHGDWTPIRNLLRNPDRNTNVGMFYAQAWLLTHYMYDDQTRASQLNSAMRAIGKGADPVKAIEEATGASADHLAGQLRGYRQIHISRFGGQPGPAPVVTVTPIPQAEGELRLDQLRLAVANVKKGDAGFLRDLKARAAKAPGDERLQLTAAEAEYVYGDPAAGDAIAERFLSANGDDVQALATAGLGEVRAAERFPDRKTALYRAARASLIKAYQLDKSDYRVLFAYALSRSVEPAYPNDNDVNALLEARNLAPSVAEISLWAGDALMRRGEKDVAMGVLAAIANSPHNEHMAKAAHAVMDGKSLQQALADDKKD